LVEVSAAAIFGVNAFIELVIEENEVLWRIGT
jgi:hypothetical protein